MDESIEISELLYYKERLEQTLKGTSSATFNHDFKKELVFFDKMGMALLGLEKPALSFEEWTSVIHPDDKDKATSILFDGLKNKVKHIDFDYRVKSLNTELKHIQVKSLVKYETNVPVKAFGIIIDITQQKKNEIELI